MSDKMDRRVRYSKQMLTQSLLDLMREKTIDKITVKEICAKADVNRGTFYTHFSDPYDLLNQIEDALYRDILDSIEGMLSAEDISGLLAEILRRIQKNRELCEVLFSEFGDKSFLNKIIFIARDRSIAEWRTFLPSVPEGRFELMYAFFSSGSVAVIQSWIQSGMTESPKELAAFIEKLTVSGLRALK